MYAQGLQSLGSVTVQPANVSRRSQAMLMLKNIDKVQVKETVKLDGHRYYHIDIFLKQVQSRIPTNANEGEEIPQRRPDLQVKHRYSDFMDLRYAMHKHARGSHEDHTTCSYCTQIVNYAVVGRAQPGLFTALTQVGSSAKIALVDAFINDMMQLALSAEVQYPGRCRAQHTVPALLSAFLQPEPQDEY
ncbi:hypothetical protein Poli38472_002644 [Pythium oligandrum]|uniref:PX domain-containing protein n=1 Tax=Pythium oligandrum TaxID=41045 RepID=A0A8K1FMI8_PYTOL|nr:hypothetical protein Poli38472_002644 [Pythium oligandrum]|eukprot:TMW63703.1 hypothetical protein Poli38472_002644 [Pythium oligandrum]